MDEISIFEKATRARVRFPFRGLATTEDLWDMTLPELNMVYKTLNSECVCKEEGLIEVKTKEDELIELKLAMVKYVFTKMNDEKNAKILAAEARKQRSKILSLVAEKRDEKLRTLSEDELLKLAESLE